MEHFSYGFNEGWQLKLLHPYMVELFNVNVLVIRASDLLPCLVRLVKLRVECNLDTH